MTAESVRIKHIRQSILCNLDLVYPSGLRTRSLYQTVCAIDEMYDFNLFGKDIAYLKDKGYISYIDDAFGGMTNFADRTVKLTATGKEIAERTQTDTALEI